MSLLLLLRRRAVVAPSLLTGLAAYWKLDEASGTRADSLGVSHLTDNNTVTQSTGKVENAAQFTNANSESLSCADTPTLSTGEISFTLAFWFYLDALAADRQLVSKDGSGQREYDIFAQAGSNLIIFECYKTTGASDQALKVIPAAVTGAWHFAVAWRDLAGGSINIAVDNGAPGTGAITGIQADKAAAFRLGGRDWGDAYMGGRLDEVGYWKRVLTVGERTALYNGGAGRSWPFTGA